MDENIELDEQPNSLDENTATDFSFLEEDESGRDDVIDSVEVPETAPTETVENTDTVETPAVEVESSPYEFLTMSAMENAKSDETEMSPVSTSSSVTEMLTNAAMENAATGNQLAQAAKSDDPFADFIPSMPAAPAKEETKADTTVEDYFSKYNDPLVEAMQNLVENPTPANLDAFYTARNNFSSAEAKEMNSKIADDNDLSQRALDYEKDHPTAATIADKLGDALDKAENTAKEAKKNEGAAKETKVAPYDEQLFKLAESQVTDPYSDINFQINELNEQIARREANLAKEGMPDSYRDRQEKMLKEEREELAKYESQLATYQAYYDTYKEKVAAEMKPKEPSDATKAVDKSTTDADDALDSRLKADGEFYKATGMEGTKENAESVLNSPDSTAEQISAAEQLLSAIAKEEGTDAALTESYKKRDEESKKTTEAAKSKAEELIKEGKTLEATNVLIEASKDASSISFVSPTIDVAKDDGTTETVPIDEFIDENATAGAEMINELQSLSNPTTDDITNVISKFDPTLANFLKAAITQDWTKSNAASGQSYAQRGQALAQQLSDIWNNKSNVIQAVWDSIKAVVKAAGDFKDITKDTQAYRLIKNAQKLTTRAIVTAIAAVTGGPIAAIAVWAGSLAKDNLVNLIKNTTLDPEIAKVYESFADTQDKNEATDEVEGKNYEEGLVKKWDKNDVTIDNKGYNKGLEEKEVSRKELPSDAFVKIIYKKEPWIRKFHV